jgi:hypothetical protein
MNTDKSSLENENQPSCLGAVISFPDNVEIWKWWQTQKFQKEQGESVHNDL